MWDPVVIPRDVQRGLFWFLGIGFGSGCCVFGKGNPGYMPKTRGRGWHMLELKLDRVSKRYKKKLEEGDGICWN